MVHSNVSNSYKTTTDAAEDCDTERGSRDHHKVVSFTQWRNQSWYKPNSDLVGKLDTSIARH